jgi:hypothetical protein
MLNVLSARDAKISDWEAWYPLDVTVVRRVMDQLYMRKLAQVVRWEGNTRVWGLTPAGARIVETLDPPEEES